MCERWTHQSGSPSLFDLPHTDDVSHFVQDESFDIAIRFHFTYVEYVEGHFPCETDGWTGTPNTGRSCEAEYVVSVRTPCTVDFLQRSADREMARRVLDRSSARDMGYNLRPPAETIKHLVSENNANERACPLCNQAGTNNVSTRQPCPTTLLLTKMLGSNGKKLSHRTGGPTIDINEQRLRRSKYSNVLKA